MPDHQFVLTLSCPDRPGIVSAVSTFLAHNGQNISTPNSSTMSRPATSSCGWCSTPPILPWDWRRCETGFAAIADRFGMDWQMRDRASRRRVMLLVSKFDHCLADLLYRWRTGELSDGPDGDRVQPPRETYARLDFGDLPFHYLPVTKETKMAQEAADLDSGQRDRRDLVVLARYMQILSDALSAKLLGRCINIHHSFLPGFKGAKPYHQAHERGVKLIGATAHYVTARPR